MSGVRGFGLGPGAGPSSALSTVRVSAAHDACRFHRRTRDALGSFRQGARAVTVAPVRARCRFEEGSGEDLSAWGGQLPKVEMTGVLSSRRSELSTVCESLLCVKVCVRDWYA